MLYSTVLKKYFVAALEEQLHLSECAAILAPWGGLIKMLTQKQTKYSLYINPRKHKKQL